uniref:Photosystem I reaction center subunit VIII n=1 Tax=Cuscuta africana TaxID=413235 RepID=A0A7H0DGS0_9ASTE|nr:photosystem I subunit VIII [Cuscuta africana]QNP08530.1 photosystem I subunit VIII [Cuscuta africana]
MSHLPSICVPLVGLVLPAIAMVYLFITVYCSKTEN